MVFAVGHVIGLRNEFQCLVPGGYVGRPIVKMTAMRVTWNQKHALSQNLWCLPPSFASDALAGYDCEKLEIIYRHEWMPTFPNLRLIYVPIEEDSGHWFLMVINIEERKIYQLDPFLTDSKIEGRQQQIRKVAEVLSRMILEIYESDVPFCALPDFDNWKIQEARGVPNYGNSDSSGLWVAEWINMQNSFTGQITGVVNPDHVRMRVGLRLLLGPHNQYKESLETNAKKHWNNIMMEG